MSVIRQLVESQVASKTGAAIFEGVHQARLMVEDMLDQRMITPQQILLKDMFEYLLAPPGSELYNKYGYGAIEHLARNSQMNEIAEAIAGSGDFNTLFTKYLNTAFIPEYNEIMEPWDVLYTELPSDDKVDFHGGLIDVDEPFLTGEGAPAHEGEPVEKYVEIENFKVTKFTKITEEVILFDKTGGKILDKVRRTGKGMARMKRRYILYRIQDRAYTENGYNLSANTTFKYGGSTAAMYSSDHSAIDQTNDNLGSGTTVSTNNMSTAYKLLAAITDYWGRIINLTGDTLLVGSDNAFAASQLFNSPQIFDDSANGTNPVKDMGLIQNVRASSEVSASTWFYGNFKDQFVLQQVRRPSSDPAGADLKYGVAAQYRHSDFFGFGARDYRLVVKMA